MMADIAQFENRIAGENGFQNKTLLITGGTGFLGNVLIEKVLKACPLVEKIYVTVRAKNGINCQTRLKKMFESPLFDLLKKTRGEEILKKVVAVPGNISEENLGLTDEYRELITENVEIIYHMAASTRFDLSIKEAIMTNTVSTREMIKLAKECKKLLVFVYVSTAYCFLQEQILYEKVYSLPLNPNDIIKVVETMQEADEKAFRKKYMNEHPNTYTFSKALSEMLVSEEMDNLPLIIARPSIIIPVWKDPLPGWTNNFLGPTGLFVAGGRGILRSMHGNANTYADFLPVDMTADALQVVTYDYMTNRCRRIFNLTSSSEVKVTWKELIDLVKNIATTEMPFNWVVWYPGGSLQSSKFVHNVFVILFHYAPAIILDLLLILTANKPVLWKIHQKLTRSFHLFEYYTTHQWEFNNDNLLEVRKLLNETEKKIYRIDPRNIDVKSYIYDCIHGTRLYLLKEGDETLPIARKRIKMMWALDRFLKALIFIGVGYVIIQCFINS